MIHGDILNIEPSEIKFPFELMKEISCTVHLSNISDSKVDYKVYSTNPGKYWIQPNNGVILPRSTCDIVVYMYKQNEAPLDLLCTDMFMIRSMVTSRSPKPGEVGPEMLTKESRHELKVVYIHPHQQCSAEENDRSEFEVTRAVNDIKDKLSETCLGKLLKIVPSQLELQFELNKKMSCSLQLTNITKHHVAFKVKTTNSHQYSARPNMGIVLPDATCDITVTMQAQKDTPSDMQCKDKFLIQSVVATSGIAPKDITSEMFGHNAEECKLKVVYVISPPQPPSPIAEGSDEGDDAKEFVMEKRSLDGFEVSKNFVDTFDESPEQLLQLKEKENQGDLWWSSSPLWSELSLDT